MSSSANDAQSSEPVITFRASLEFAKRWEELGFDSELNLEELQSVIANNPLVGKVVGSTGGLRKMRFARADRRIGKRGGVRVCYVFFPEYSTVLLVTAYGKTEKDDLTPKEKKYIREYIRRIKVELDRMKDLDGN
jgi:hypothetical protein